MEQCNCDGVRGPFEFDKVYLDRLDDAVWMMADDLNEMGYAIIIMSGRSEECREETEAWLKDNRVPYDRLYMRAEGDHRPDWHVKYDLFNEFVRNDYWVHGVFDDRDQVVDLWRQMGIKCYQVERGAF